MENEMESQNTLASYYNFQFHVVEEKKVMRS